jgi:hypothetical protein
VAALLARDLSALESGERGDFLVEWATFDTDGDGLKETTWPRLRLVRQVSEAELARMEATTEAAELAAAQEQADESVGIEAADRVQRLGPVLIEVCWAVMPMNLKDRDGRAEGLVYRGARRLEVGSRDSYFDDKFISTNDKPNTATLDEVTGGLLWFQPLMATQTSIVHDGWVIGDELPDAATAWDAWALGRPDSTRHHWNVNGAGMPRVDRSALLPRRIRIEMEFERAIDRKRRTKILQQVELGDVDFEVDDERLIPEPGSYIKLDGEWMEIRTLRGNHVTVRRGVRGTQPMIHDAGTMVHWGLNLVREVPVELYREDWNL